MTNKQPPPLTQEELQIRIANHQKWLQDWKPSLHDFSWVYIWKYNKSGEFHNLEANIFHNANLSYANFSESKIRINIDNTILQEANFQWADIEGISFYKKDALWEVISESYLLGADFRGALYWNLDGTFTTTQKSQIILTDRDYEKYQKEKRLSLQNEEHLMVRKNTSKNQVNKLTHSFEKLAENYKKEESMWLTLWWMSILNLLLIAIMPLVEMIIGGHIYKYIGFILLIIVSIVFALMNNITYQNPNNNQDILWDLKKIIKDIGIMGTIFFIIIIITLWIIFFLIPQTNVRIFQNLPIQLSLIPIVIVLFTILWFTLRQYTHAKNLRIENQNKVALLHGMIWIKADTDEKMEKTIFYEKISEVVFSKVKHGKNDNLPVDKVIEIFKSLPR